MALGRLSNEIYTIIAFCGVERDIGHAPLGGIQVGPGLLQLGRVMGAGDQFDRESAQNTLRGDRGQRTVLGQQTRSLQARQGMLRHARRFQGRHRRP